MKKFSKKGVLLFVGAMALCAFALPSMASASSWGVVGSEHTLDSANVGFTSHVNQVSSSCSQSQFTVDVRSTAALTITSASFTGCTQTGPSIGTCTMTSKATNLPWTATAVSTNNIQIHGIHLDVGLENHPGSTSCGAAGVQFTITGTLTGARWTGNTRHGLDLEGLTGNPSSSMGLVATSSLSAVASPVTIGGTVFDTQNSLTVTN
jgi:hypothetical protein